MVGPTARTYTVGDITHGPVDIWFDVAAPGAAAELTIDVTGGVATPETVANPNAYHMGLSEGGASLLYKPTLQHVMADELTSPYRSILESEEIVISPKGALQLGQNLTMLSKVAVGATLSAPSGKSKVTFGGNTVITFRTVLAIWMQADSTTKYMYWLLYRAFNDQGVAMDLSRKKDASSDYAFRGFADPARAALDQTLQIVKLT